MMMNLRRSLRLMKTVVHPVFGKLIKKNLTLLSIILFSESDIHALEILKNQNLLVLGREGIEINPDRINFYPLSSQN